jgi:hypothetical protein
VIISNVKNVKYAIILILSLILFGSISNAQINFPKNMTKKNREVSTRILGLGSSMKILSDPYPLGGYAGFEIGLTSEILSTADISHMGSSSNQKSEISYSMLSMGKGIFNNLDLYVQFTPTLQSENISGYGAQMRWTFLEADYFPFYLTFAPYANSMNFKNQITTLTQGYDLFATFNVENISLYFGTGPVRSVGTFSGGTNSVTNTGVEESEDVADSHFAVGLNIRMNKAFIAFQNDRYNESVYSFKLGYRF